MWVKVNRQSPGGVKMECGVPANSPVLALPPESYNILIQEGILYPQKRRKWVPESPISLLKKQEDGTTEIAAYQGSLTCQSQ